MVLERIRPEASNGTGADAVQGVEIQSATNYLACRD